MDELAQRAAGLGIERDYADARGMRRAVPPETLRRLVEALAAGGVPTSPASTYLWRHGRSTRLAVGAADGARWRVLSGEDEIARGAISGGGLCVPDATPPGLYRLEAEGLATARLLVAPETAYQLDDGAGTRVWALAVQLYAVRSRRNWGHGDFTDLAALVRLAADVGASGIGLNPLHALFDDRPDHASPYAPNSRLFLNPLYIDPEAVPEFPGLKESGLAAAVERLRGTDEVDYQAVAAAKGAALRLAFDRFRRGGDARRHAAFAAFCAERGEALTRFAAFEVLRRRFHDVWWNWPAEWRQPTPAALARLRAEAGDALAYYEYVQWLADEQLAACRQAAQARGLPIGLYVDLAVGVEPGGADAWSAQESIVPRVEVGAPPDLLNTAGQAWGLAAFNPRALEAEAFAPFATLLRAAMRHAGAIRLDHVLGLNRLFLIPFGLGPQDGAYVRYPLQGLLATAAIESARRRCLVIGEDLGTVPEELRDILADWGIWSYLVMLFERDGARFKHPHEYRRNAVVTFSTHDLPSFAGWVSGHDLRVKRAIGLDPGESEADRERALNRLRDALQRSGLGRDGMPQFVDIVRFLARTPSRLLVVALDDILGVLDQPNVPGTLHEHPNWRRRLPAALEELADDGRMRAVAAALREEGRSV
ncbi:MAG: 4-alpha-glucanotransferase [Variibacter sp.]|nr:4-alpha-glucanotransferase [Variibacter sp.]